MKTKIKAETKADTQEEQVDSCVGGNVIVLKNLTKKYGNNVVLNNINLSIERGKTTVIIGPSGCGKTMLIKHLIVLLRPSSGEIYFENKRIDNLS